MKNLKYLLFIFIFIFIPNCYALDYNVSSQVTSPVAPSNAGTYTGEELNGATSSWNINTRYQGTLQRIRYNIPLPSGWLDGQCFAIGNTYTITMNMATNDWRNYFGTVRVVPYSNYSGNWSNGRVNFISRKKISFTFTIPDSYTSCVDFIYVDLPSSAIFTAFTGETNWNLSSIVLTDPMYTSGGSGSGSGSTGSTNQDIINNNNQNTENIINNQNDNTSNIVENNNQNTQIIIDNQNENTNKVVNELANVCPNLIDLTKINNCRFYNNSADSSCGTSILNKNNSTGSVTFSTSNDWMGFTTDFISVSNSTMYYLKFTRDSVFDGIVKVNFYTSNQQFISQINAWNNNLSSFTTPNNCSFIKISFENANSQNNITLTSISLTEQNVSFCAFGSTTSKLDSTNNAINETNDYLKDDSDPSISDSEFTDLFNTVGFNDPLGYLLQLPVQFINQLVSQSNSCQTISLGTLWGVSLSMPCINIGSIIGQQVWDIIDVLFSVGLLVVIFKNLYQTFANLMTMGGEKEAREKFSMPTPMEFLSMILGGDK